jgi:hypothetical protein
MGDFSFSFRKKPEGAPGGPPKPSAAEEQFNQLRGCGLNLDGHKTLKQVTAGQEAGAFEEAPYALLLALMGGTNEQGEPWSHDVWLYAPGEEMSLDDLAGIAINLSRLTKGAVAIEDVQAGANEENGAVQIVFTLDGEQASAEFDPAEVDPAGGIMSTLAALAAERGEGARLAFADVEGLGRLFVYLNEGEIGELSETTSVSFAPLQ